MKISVIIPIYNAEKYIAKTLESVCKQTLQDIEIICIDDCSSDKSLNIIQNIANTDNRIKIIQNKTNKGVSLSRNIGLDIAQGDYIGFIDHDDLADEKLYEQLYLIAKDGDFDMVHSDVYFHYPEGKIELHKFSDLHENGTFDLQAEMINQLLIRKKSDIGIETVMYGIWNKIYKNNFLKQYSIEFYSEKEYSNEDFLFNLQVLLNVNKVARIREAFYHHFCYTTSLGNCYSYRSYDLRWQSILLAKRLIDRSNFIEKSIFYERLYMRIWRVFVYSSSNELQRNSSGLLNAIANIWQNMDDELLIVATNKISIFETPTTNFFYKVFEMTLFVILKVRSLKLFGKYKIPRNKKT